MEDMGTDKVHNFIILWEPYLQVHLEKKKYKKKQRQLRKTAAAYNLSQGC